MAQSAQYRPSGERIGQQLAFAVSCLVLCSCTSLQLGICLTRQLGTLPCPAFISHSSTVTPVFVQPPSLSSSAWSHPSTDRFAGAEDIPSLGTLACFKCALYHTWRERLFLLRPAAAAAVRRLLVASVSVLPKRASSPSLSLPSPGSFSLPPSLAFSRTVASSNTASSKSPSAGHLLEPYVHTALCRHSQLIVSSPGIGAHVVGVYQRTLGH